MNRDSAGEVQIYWAKESRERSDTVVYTGGYGVFQSTGIPTDKAIQTDRAVEENRIQKTSISQEEYPIRS